MFLELYASTFETIPIPETDLCTARIYTPSERIEIPKGLAAGSLVGAGIRILHGHHSWSGMAA